MSLKASPSERPPPTLHYIFDPLCGWCYGAASMIDVACCVQGLRVFWHGSGMFAGASRQHITPCLRASLMASDLRIEQLTGQPFGEAYFHDLLQDPGAVLDSEPLITAMLAVEKLNGRGLEMLRRIQRAHYVQGRRVADLAVLRALAMEMGEHARTFDAAYAQQSGMRTQRHMNQSQWWFARVRALGFPAFVLERGDGELLLQEVSPWIVRPQAWGAHLRRELTAGQDMRMGARLRPLQACPRPVDAA